MKAISLFSGVGGFDLGFERAGIETVLQAERDPWCLKVLERHWPQTERVTDVRCVRGNRRGMVDANASGTEGARGWGAVQPDLIFGGFPCQDLSVAGKRAGLGGDRSGLWFEFRRIVDEFRPRWVCIENVPGLLSSNQGRDFGIVLNGLDELGYGVAWNILDAQFFGVPQRRRRVFIVGCLGDERSAAAVLSVCEGGGGDTEAGREAGERVAAGIDDGLEVAGWDPRSITSRGNRSSVEYGAPSPTLHSAGMSITVRTDQTGANGHNLGFDVASTLDGANGQAVLASPLTASAGHHGHSSPRGDGSDNLVAHSLRAQGNASHRADTDTYIPDVAPTLLGGDNRTGGTRPLGSTVDNCDSLQPTAQGVRRLTPLECQRLQGFPDWWYDGLDLADSHIYRQMGNAVCVPVAEYIGHRIMALGG
jgi:DNA (cytosine-5)-methyltransferase 1